MAPEIERNASPGMNELVTGSASFEQVVTSVPGTDVHFIAAGAAIAGPGAVIDPDLVNLLLDALDEAYEHIIVVGRYDASRGLFESILGRFDAGVLVSEENSAPSRRAAPGMFLGFEVADIAVMRHERALEATAAVPVRPAPVQIAPVHAPRPAAANVARGKPQHERAPEPAVAATAARAATAAPQPKVKSGFSLPSLSSLGRGKSKAAVAEKPAPSAKPGKVSKRRKGEADDAPTYAPVPQAELVARALRRPSASERSASA